MAAKHTPGPWSWSGPDYEKEHEPPACCASYELSGPDDASVLSGCGSCGNIFYSESDGRLIAAAPTMADAIRAAAQAAAVGSDADGGFARIPRALFDALENALDAATGEYSKETA